MPRRPRQAMGGYVFHVLNRAAAQRTLFREDGDYAAFLGILHEAQQQVPMRILSYCVMPNHWHLVLWPTGDDDLSEYMKWLTTTHAQRWHKWHESTGTGALYQGRFKSFPTQEDDHFWQVCRYVERNSLRANLVSRAELWRWSSLWQRINQGTDVSLASWPLPPGSRWNDYVNQPETEAELAALRKSVTQGIPFGDADWVERTGKALGIETRIRSAGRPRTRW
ncbi:MAG: transposase [Pirellulaceae bacterium]